MEVRRRIQKHNKIGGKEHGQFQHITSTVELVERTPKGANVRLATGQVIHRKAKDIIE